MFFPSTEMHKLYMVLVPWWFALSKKMICGGLNLRHSLVVADDSPFGRNTTLRAVKCPENSTNRRWSWGCCVSLELNVVLRGGTK